MLRSLMVVLMLVSYSLVSVGAPRVLPADEVYGKWVGKDGATKQHSWPYSDLKYLGQQPGLIARLNSGLTSDHLVYAGLYKLLLPGKKHDRTIDQGLPDDKQEQKYLKKFYGTLNNNIGELVTRVISTGHACCDQNKMDAGVHFQTLIDRYTQWAELLCHDTDAELQKQHLFGLANRMFTYFFDTGWPRIQPMLQDSASYPALRLLYAITWKYLSGIGWKDWHQGCLDGVKREAARGKEVVYIAGGCDTYQLLCSGVHNIRVIDPMLPSQPKYYVSAWDLFVGGNAIGDTITFDHGLKLVREKFVLHGGTLEAVCSDSVTRQIPLSTTVWAVNKNNKRVGSLTYERRYCNQDDFKFDKKRVLLISFNELYFISCGDAANWGIDPRQFNKKLKIYVKQLQKPVTAAMAQHIWQVDQTPFSFIRLGTCVK